MKKLTAYLFSALLALGGLYTYLWYLSANKLEMAIVQQVKVLEEKDYRVAYGAIRVKGFPLAINLEIDDVLIEAPAPVSASLSITGTLHGRASILKPTTVRFTANQGVDVTTLLLGNENNTVLKAQGLKAKMPLPLPLEDFAVTFEDVHIGAMDLKAKNLTLGLQLHESDKALNRYTFKMTQIDPGKELVSGLPQVIDHLQAHLSLAGKVRVDVPLDQVMAHWFKSNGSADIGLLSLKWGDLKIDANGTLALDDALQPLASFSAEIYGLDNLLDRLKDLGYIHENLLPILKTSLSFFKKTKNNGTSKDLYHKVSFTIQDQEIVLGAVPIMKTPPINWEKLGG